MSDETTKNATEAEDLLEKWCAEGEGRGVESLEA